MPSEQTVHIHRLRNYAVLFSPYKYRRDLCFLLLRDPVHPNPRQNLTMAVPPNTQRGPPRSPALKHVAPSLLGLASHAEAFPL